MLKDNILNLSSLNCNSLRKRTNPSSRYSLIRFLKHHPSHLHLIALQETNAIDQTTITSFDMSFQSQQSLWTQHCGLVALDADLNLQHIPIDLSTNNHDFASRFIFVKVSSRDHLFAPFYLLNVYAPASSATLRRSFFTQLLDSPIFNSTTPAYCDRLIITGDFNFNMHHHLSSESAPLQWIAQLQHNFIDCITDTSTSLALPTYRHGASYHNTLDFIFASRSFHSFIHEGSVEFVSRDWTDHALVSARIQLSPSHTGKGYWRGNPSFSRIPEFRQELASMLTDLWPSLASIDTPQLRWERLKSALRRFMQQFGRKRTHWRQQQLKALMSKRNRLLRAQLPPNILAQFLPRVERQISILQQEGIDIQALKARQRWRENGEISAGYLKRMAIQENNSRMITSLFHPTTGNPCTDINDLHDAATTFYQDLYTPTPIDVNALDELLASSSLPSLSSTWQTDLLTDFSIEDLQSGAKRAPTRSSPGPDGLPYSTWFLVFKHPHYHDLACSVFNMALHEGVYPASWQDTCVTLLPKKGDLQSLRNWRPISLINTDAKIFTRLLNARLVQAADSLINPFQTGFLPDRFIADNGMLAKLAMEQARGHQSSSSIALLLDQEKAYDRIHPDYLHRVLHTFGIPDTFISAITRLFFSTNIRININGHISTAFTQQRGLRQGDPISPVLFNLALEPLLRAILDDNTFEGVTLNSALHSNPLLPAMPPLKCLAYADDVMIFLSSASDLSRLQHHLGHYQLASNAKLNAHKSQALSLSGRPQVEWNTLLHQAGFPPCHDRTWATAVEYLGYPLASSKPQLDHFLAKLLSSVKSQCHQFSHRQLSVRGRATALNTLILSRIWHTLRLVGAPIKTFFQPLRGCMSGFLMHKMFPRVSLNKLCHPLDHGGLGILDPEQQQGAMQMRWLEPLFHPFDDWSTTTLALAHHIQHDHPSLSDHRFPLVFSSCRKSASKACNDIASILFKAMDLMSLDVGSLSLDVSVILHLPLNCIWFPNPGHRPQRPGYRHLLVKDIFYLNPTTGFIHWRSWQRNKQHHTSHKCLAKALHHSLVQHHLQFHPFFARIYSPLTPSSVSVHTPTRLDATPLTSCLDAHFQLKSWTSRRYRNLCHPSFQLIDSITRSRWKLFWKIPMEHQARNVWYRSIHNTLPTLTRLADYGIHHHTTTSCRLCNNAPDTVDHFLLHCPQRKLVWQAMWDDHLMSSPFDLTLLSTIIKSLKQPCPTVSTHRLFTIISCYLLALWQHYWLHISDTRRFHHLTVVAHAQRLLARFSTVTD